MTLYDLLQRIPELRQKGFSLVFSPAGQISPNACWVVFYGRWMHTGDSVSDVLRNVFDEYQQDRHLCG